MLVLGNGWIGNKLADHLGGLVFPGELSSIGDIDAVVGDLKPDVLINAIGHTGGPNVDCCERDPARTLFSNSMIPIMAAEVAIRRGIKLVHLSSGCIYDDFGYPWTEEDKPNYFDLFYSRSKIYSEAALTAIANHYGVLILRLRVPLDDKPHPRNILTKLIQYRKVIAVPQSVTYLPDFLEATATLIDRDAHGIFNVVNSGELRYPDLMEAYKRAQPDFEYEVVSLESLGIKRTNVSLDTRKISAFLGRPMPNINDRLDQCIAHYTREL